MSLEAQLPQYGALPSALNYNRMDSFFEKNYFVSYQISLSWLPVSIKDQVLSISVGSKLQPPHSSSSVQASTIMLPKMFETTVYTEQVTICPLDLFVNPPTSIYQPQAEPEYIPPSQATIDTSNCVSLFLPLIHSLYSGHLQCHFQ